MEYDNYNDNNKLGGGIIALCVLSIIGNVLKIFSSIALIAMPDTFRNTYETAGLSADQIDKILSSSTNIVNIVISILILVTIILILNKKAIGVYSYLVISLASIVISIILSGFSILNIVISLVFPIIMFILFNKKKEVFGVGQN